MNKQILSHQPSPIQPSSDQPSLAQLSESSKVKLEKSNARGKKYREIIKKNEINGSAITTYKGPDHAKCRAQYNK